VVVRVPGSFVDSTRGIVLTTLQRLSASFAVIASSEPRVQRAGTLKALSTASDADFVLRAFRKACIAADHVPPSGIRVRIVSDIPLRVGRGAGAAAAVAGVVGARALLDLPLDDVTAVRVATEIAGARHRVTESLAASTCTLAPTCDDEPATGDTAIGRPNANEMTHLSNERTLDVD